MNCSRHGLAGTQSHALPSVFDSPALMLSFSICEAWPIDKALQSVSHPASGNSLQWGMENSCSAGSEVGDYRWRSGVHPASVGQNTL